MSDGFHSPTWGDITLPSVRTHILGFIKEDIQRVYRLVIGTDSQTKNGDGVDFVTAIVIHRVGAGGIYFWKRTCLVKRLVLRERMYEEAARSLETADNVLALLKSDGFTRYDVEIHVDIGSFGPTRDMISEIVGMIRGVGYAVKIKPESFAASKVADKYT